MYRSEINLLSLRDFGVAILIAGGTLQEEADPEMLRNQPVSAAAQEFAKSGTCAAPSPDTDTAMLDEAFVEKYKPVVNKPKDKARIIPFGPRGFRWIERNKLAAYILQGMSAADAIQKLRVIDPRMIQSREQEQILAEYADYTSTASMSKRMKS